MPAKNLWIVLFVAGIASFASSCLAQSNQPNVVLIVADDAGFADFSFQGSLDITTPNIDSIANSGVQFKQAYASAWVCSPTRAGLLTGRYQQRFGHEFNVPAFYNRNGLPTSEITIASWLKTIGYQTIAVGKWHLGYVRRDFHPLNRGFDNFYGFYAGARSYRPSPFSSWLFRIHRDFQIQNENFSYLTDELADEAANYIRQNKNNPFFLYLSFNAVHTPMQVKAADYWSFSNISNTRRRRLAAMTKAMDDGVGTVLDELDRHGLTENTIVIFINDNGGAPDNASDNFPFSGEKLTPYEGGIRVPMLMKWPGQIRAGSVYNYPVSSLDIFPTIAETTGIWNVAPYQIDGVNLLPYLQRQISGRPHRELYWRGGNQYAVREINWKLLKDNSGREQLFYVPHDPTESNDLSDQYPNRVRRLKRLYENWESQMIEPAWFGAG